MLRYVGVKVRDMLRFQTAGESHGQGLVAILQGLPAGVRVDFDYVNRELKRRQGGFRPCVTAPTIRPDTPYARLVWGLDRQVHPSCRRFPLR